MWTNVPSNEHMQYQHPNFVTVVNGMALDVFVFVKDEKGEDQIECIYTVMVGMSFDAIERFGPQAYVDLMFQHWKYSK